MSKSAIYVANTGAQAVAVDGTIGLGSIIRRFGCGVDLNGNGITIDEAGYYDIDISVTAAPTAAGDVTVTMYNNGVAIPGVTATTTAATANDPVNVSLAGIVRVFCGNIGSLSLVLTGTAASVTNVATVVTRL